MSLQTPNEGARVKHLQRVLKVVLLISTGLWLASLVVMTAYPWVFWGLAIPNVAATYVIIRLDREIIKSGGKSFWSTGRFRDD